MASPAHKIRIGNLQVTIWRNTSEKGTWYSTNPSRSFKLGDEPWRETDSLGFDEMLPHIVALAEAALAELIATRRREGEKLADAIRERVARMRELVAVAVPRMPAIVSAYQERLSAKLRDVMASLDEDRIRQEVALYAQRIDVAEELTRLSTHLDEVERILLAPGAAGKRLDFLMQELNREANTLASKSPAADITAIAMEMKVLIEQMREQVQNIE